MRSTIALAVIALAVPALPAGAQTRVAVAAVAAHSGYNYRWSTQGSVVVLSRPGIVVVLRPGSQVYQVNDHDEVADAAPSYSQGDLYVTSSLAGHLEALARRLSPTAAHSAENLSITDAPSARGAITMEARQLQGAEAIDVEGSAPAGLPVTITLLAVFSSDIPTVLVGRHDIVTDVNGRFGAIIPIASAFERGTVLRVVATSSPGVASATEQLIVGAPNNGVTVPLEQLPH